MTETIFKTESGWEITYKTDLTYGQSIELQKYLSSGQKVTINPTSQTQESTIEGNRALDALSMAMEYLIVRITKPDKTTITTNFRDEINNIPAKEAKDFQNTVLQIIKDAIGGEKKA